LHVTILQFFPLHGEHSQVGWLTFLEHPQVNQMIGYAVGEVVSPTEGEYEGEVVRLGRQYYEIVTAWVHPGYRGLNISINMYLSIIQQGRCGQLDNC
jgi:ribosomal protein S18 acetylase RimI-like enzyme